MNKKVISIIALIFILLLSACGNKEVKNGAPENEKLTVYTTVYPLQYFTERIGGEFVDAQSIYPAGADEHSFEPTQKDMMALADSDLFFYIGLGLEGFVDNAKKTLKNEHVKLLATADDIPVDHLEEGHDEEDGHDHDHHNAKVDPHVWISPTLSVDLALSIKQALVEADPAHADQFEANFETLQKELKTLDAQFKEMAATVPSKTFFVSHAAFGYLADAYGLDQVAIAGLNTQSEPSQKQLSKIVAEAKSKDVKYVLFEQNISSKLTEVVRKEIGAESLVLHNLGVLMPEDLENHETYFTLMEHNIEVLRTALSGS